MRITLFAILVFASQICQAQFPQILSSSDLHHNMHKAQKGTSVLYVAAHPDDENTRLISYFENKEYFRTAYLSLTRGDGGQNLIGTEIGAAIGVLRTQELLGARRVDGGEQFFTRAVDFGYSKSSEETFELWERDSILFDMVWAIRKFRPDVIVTRFPPTDYAGHGHHKASAILAEIAFDMAADPTAFPSQLDELEVWQTKSMYFNTSTWWIKDLEEQAANSEDEFIRINVGEYNAEIGESYSQIAARSRSQHRSQGFGSDYPSGNQIEYIKYVKGEKLNLKKGKFENRWELNQAQEAKKHLDEAVTNFDYSSPEMAVPALIAAAKELSGLEQTRFVKYKRNEIEGLILNCIGFDDGLFFKKNYLVPNSAAFGRLNLTNPTELEVEVKKASFNGQSWEINKTLKGNDLYSEEYEFIISENFPTSNPYWLTKPYSTTYMIENRDNIGKPQNDPSIYADVELSIDGYDFTRRIPAFQKDVDPAKAVIYNPVYVVPELSFNFSENVLVATGDQGKSIFLTVKNHGEATTGTVSLMTPPGWVISPDKHEVTFEEAGESALLEFKVKSSERAKEGDCVPFWNTKRVNQMTYSLQEIKYDHIPAQIILSPAKMALRPVDLNKGGVQLIGYIDGPGDDVDKYLRAAGYDVEIIEPEALLVDGALAKYDAIVTGIRAYNTREDLAYANDKLNEYVSNGGTWLVQYNTSRRVKADQIGPYPFTLTRERVTDENAAVKVLAPEHPVMMAPNKIEAADWDNWVQERGLYFAADWDDSFSPILSWSDGDEPAREGGLIIAEHGKGYFVYSGISFFRELPAGVPGAYRLLANILALSSDKSRASNE